MNENYFSQAEIMHNLGEQEPTRFDGFKSNLESAINSDSTLAKKINKKCKPQNFKIDADNPGYLIIGKIVYVIFKNDQGVFAETPYSCFYLGCNEQEVRNNIRSLKMQCSQDEGLEDL